VSTGTYDRIMNVCIACGVLSALLFEHAGSLRPIVGGLGVLAGAVAVTSYFRNRWTSASPHPSAEKSLAVPTTEIALNKAVITEPPTCEPKSPFVTYVYAGTAIDWGAFGEVRRLSQTVVPAFGVASWQTIYYSPVLPVQYCDPVKNVVEIVKRLSEEEEPPFEFILGRDGSLTIRPSREHKAGALSKHTIAAFEEDLVWEKRLTGPN
jgi:hypothetical protein